MASLFLETAPFEYSSSKKSNSSKYNKDEDEDEEYDSDEDWHRRRAKKKAKAAAAGSDEEKRKTFARRSLKRILGRSLSISSKKRSAIGEGGSYSLHKVIVGGGDADSKDNGGRPAAVVLAIESPTPTPSPVPSGPSPNAAAVSASESNGTNANSLLPYESPGKEPLLTGALDDDSVNEKVEEKEQPDEKLQCGGLASSSSTSSRSSQRRVRKRRVQFDQRRLNPNYVLDEEQKSELVGNSTSIPLNNKDRYGGGEDSVAGSPPPGGGGSGGPGSTAGGATGQGANGSFSSNRMLNHRTSLLGKPINYRANRRDVKYRKLQAKLYNFLERPTTRGATIYHALVFVIVFLCLGLSVFATIEDHQFEVEVEDALFYLEIVVVVWFSIEFFFRLWSAGCRSRYQGMSGRFRFVRSPFCIIDMITICASTIVLSGPNNQMFAASALRGLRFFQILRMVRMDRRGGTWKLLGSVVYAHRQELITTIYIGFLGLIFSSFLIYLVEKDENKMFRSFADALWWGLITLCTVGYGDAVPVTWKGKVIASCCALLGISFFALPAGILGSGFALKVQQQQRQKHMIRRRVPAATLIQCLWRCYAADENSASSATWKIHMIPQRVSPPFKNNASFVTRFNTLRRGHRPAAASQSSPLGNASFSRKLQPTSNVNASCDNVTSTDDPVKKSSDGRRGGSGNNSLAPTPTPRNMSPASRAASPSHSAAGDAGLPLVLCNLLNREFSGARSPGGATETSGFGGGLRRFGSFRGRLAGYKFPHKEEMPPEDDIEDEEETLQPITLTKQHKGAIRAIRKLKYMAARRRFKEALKPYDVKDVIESYSAGHADLVGKVRGLSQRLDQILGRQGSKAKDVYDSKQSLASRIVKTERQVDDIEDKLDRLIGLYEEDRKRFAQIPFGSPHCPPCTPLAGSPSPPYVNQGALAGSHLHQQASAANSVPLVVSAAPQMQGRPRPILVDPTGSNPALVGGNEDASGGGMTNSPTAASLELNKQHFPSKRPMKKRVTLSSIPPDYIAISDLDSTARSAVAAAAMMATAGDPMSAPPNVAPGPSGGGGGIMIPPSLRIEGCTPPSESSLDGEEQLYKYGARCSIDSTFEFRQTDLVDVEAARPVTEIVITPSSLEGDGAERRRRSLPRVIVEENSSSVDRFATTTTASDGDTTTGAEETEPESSSSFDRRSQVRRTASSPMQRRHKPHYQ